MRPFARCLEARLAFAARPGVARLCPFHSRQSVTPWSVFQDGSYGTALQIAWIRDSRPHAADTPWERGGLQARGGLAPSTCNGARGGVAVGVRGRRSIGAPGVRGVFGWTMLGLGGRRAPNPRGLSTLPWAPCPAPSTRRRRPSRPPPCQRHPVPLTLSSSGFARGHGGRGLPHPVLVYKSSQGVTVSQLLHLSPGFRLCSVHRFPSS